MPPNGRIRCPAFSRVFPKKPMRARRQRNPLPAPKIFLQKRLSQKGYPLSGANRFWTDFWERGRD
jgi:hypothetical protein